MYFVVLCLDKPESLGIRMENRAAHLAYLAANAANVKLGGPFLDSSGQMCGSMLLFSCPDEAAARALLASDPFLKAGLFESVELRPFRPSVGVSLE
ncbi:YciI family protein [uncultured Rhodoblastus sp.]|uniref:YciI family protein n=1 Tax=uncultured Rhodoblastus sp. TaxID=543037 RepID=UPI0025F317CD|nr:YciI family protein [uncultured Rhodoblastus sp.]